MKAWFGLPIPPPGSCSTLMVYRTPIIAPIAPHVGYPTTTVPKARVLGDTLSKIAKQHYGNAMKYPVIFEANKPMLEHPDKIYPGQVLRIPPIEG